MTDAHIGGLQVMCIRESAWLYILTAIIIKRWYHQQKTKSIFLIETAAVAAFLH